MDGWSLSVKNIQTMRIKEFCHIMQAGFMTVSHGSKNNIFDGFFLVFFGGLSSCKNIKRCMLGIQRVKTQLKVFGCQRRRSVMHHVFCIAMSVVKHINFVKDLIAKQIQEALRSWKRSEERR